MKRLFIVGILIMILLTGTMLLSTTAIARLGEDGLALSESAGVMNSLRSGDGDAVELVPVNYDDTVYSSLTGYYVGKARKAIDKAFPIFINGGAGLRFLDEEVWLFSVDVDLVRTFEGLYLNGGTTYNSDMSQADQEEFILLVLSNGLHMNAQHVVLTNRLGSTDIPANSILCFSEEALRWYCLEGQSLIYGEETALYGASITIGEHTYDYYDLLKAIGVIDEAVDKLRAGKNADEQINEIIEILGDEDEEDETRRQAHSASAETQEDLQSSASAAAQTPNPAIGSQSEGRENDQDLPAVPKTGTPETGDGNTTKSDPKREENDSISNADGDAGNDEADNAGAGDGESDDKKDDAPDNGDGSGSDDGDGGDANGDSGDIGDSGSGSGGSSAAEGSGSGSGSGAGGGSNSGADEGDNSGDPTQNDPGTGGEQGSGGAVNPDAGTGSSGTGSGVSGPPAYRDPEVTLQEIDTWSYAFHGKLTITDPANTVIKGVRISIYRDVTGSGATTVDEDGHTIYPADSYEGKTALLRKTYAGTQEFAMATLPPDSDIYVQYTYRYNGRVEVDELDSNGDPTGNKVEEVRRITVTSDIIRLKTPDNTEIAPVAASWEECFAVLDKDIRLDALMLRNTTDYDPDAETFDYENFKKDTLSYVNRLEFTLTPADGGEAVVLSTNSSVLREAKTEHGAIFTSSGGRLQPSTKYTYTVRAVDRYGKTMPLMSNGSDSFSGILYTCKTAPTVKIEEISNVTDQLTLSVTVNDPFDALLDEALKLSVVDTSGEEAELYGTWENGGKFGDASGSSSVTSLELAEPAQNKTYTFTLDSLAFARAYTVRVTGSYDLQPSGVTTPQLNPVMNALLGTGRSYTASLSTGNIQFSAVTSEISDTYATLGFTMNKNTTLNILPIVDAFKLTVQDAKGSAVITTTLKQDDLDTAEYEYDSKIGAVVLQEANAAEHTPRIELVGSENQFAGLTLWEALLLRAYEDAEGYASPVQIRVSVTEGTLETSSSYQLTMESLVYKSGIEYQVPTSLTTNQFRTKKIQPVLQYEDFFVGGDVAQFIGLRILDKDETIQQGGLVYVDLYYGETLLSTQELYATGDPESVTMDLVFENIISDAAYTIVFRAAAYNDGGGFAANKQLWIFDDFLGGSGLSGKLTLEGLEYTSTRGAGTTLVHFTGAEAAEKIESEEWTADTANARIKTERFALPEGATFVRIDGLGYDRSANTVIFYDAAGKELRWYAASRPSRTTGGLLTGVPAGAETMAVYLSSEASVKARGLQIDCYTAPQENLVTAANALIPVQPGDLLCLSPNAGEVTLYNEAQKTIGSVSSVNSAVFVVPDRASYISLNSAACGAYKVASAEQEQGYTATVSAVVQDNEGYLAKLTETPQATVSVYQSENIVDPVYDSKPMLSQVMELTEQEDGAWTAFMTRLLEQLDAACGYKMVLTAEYRGSTVVLDTIAFRTDGVYFTISNEDELQAVNQNRYANYIVVEDFTVTRAMNIYLHGTIDFQGHVITNQAPANNLFSCVYQEAEVRNLVVEYPKNASIEAALFEENYGLVDDLIVRTNGTLTVLNASALIVSQNRGTVRDFILRLGGDLYLSSSKLGGVTSLVAYRNLFGAVIENGYVYGANGAGVVFAQGVGGYNGGILIGSSQYGIIQNVFTRMDIWFPTEQSGTDGYTIGLLRSLSGTFENIYHVGDYYLLGSDGQKNLSYRLETERFFHNNSTRSAEGLWHISQYSYSDTQANLVSSAAPAVLYDSAWQQQVLGDGFDVESCVSMGFYPRLKLSACMQKYQEYLPLPTLYDDAPKLVSDGMAEGFVQGNEAGAILLRFQNERGLPIRSVDINGLQVNQIHSQERGEDGLWNVVVDVTALAYYSAYEVESFTYLNGTAIQSVPHAKYTTTGIEFWKEVDSLADWRDINDHMDWNYRLTEDLDFESDTLLPSAIMLNGSKTEMSKTVKFTGKLDGGYYENGVRKLHIIRGMSLVDTMYPYVIYRMGSGSVLSNLVIENMTLTASTRSASKYSGFVAYAESVRIENVHVRDSQFCGVGSMGAILGETSTSAFSFRECSVADTTISDAGTDTTVYAGGLAGRLTYGNIESCYARNIELSIQRSASVGGVGGLFGYNEMNTLRNCYSTGVIYAAASQVGGILGCGNVNSRVVNCWSSMDLFVTGDYVGSIGGGHQNYKDSFLLGVGSISASGEHVGRLFGSSGFASADRIGYAFAGQTVTGLEEGENGDVTGLLTSQQLGRRATWTDLIRMGSAFEYDSLANGCFPKVLNSEGALVWGQEDIPIPGLGGDHSIIIQEAVYDELLSKYYIIGQWVHPGYTTEELVAALEKGLVTEELSVVLDGLGLTDEYILNGRTSIDLSYTGEGKSNLSITCSDLTKALDTYTLTAKYGGISVQTDIDFGEPLYHDVPDLATWNELMRSGHGDTGENFRITGQIDFEGADAEYRDLKLGRLVGVQKGAKAPCFCNMNYSGGYSGEPWIESVSGGITGLAFENITADFAKVISSARRSATGLVLSVSSVENCDFEQIHIGCSGYSSDSVGFFATVNGSLSEITMKTMSLTTESASVSNYGGALAGYVHGGISDLTAEDVLVDLPKTSYTGGIVGYKDRTLPGTVTRVTLRDIRVEGSSYVGSLAGSCYRSITQLTLDGFTVKAYCHAGGLAGYEAGNVTNVTVKNGSVTTTSTTNKNYYTGGVVGSLQGYAINTVLVQNVDVTGVQHTGGLLGLGECDTAGNIQILGCTIVSNGDFTNASAGGVFGYSDYALSATSRYQYSSITVRDTAVQAVFAAGGIGGKAVRITANRCYIAEDVTVTAVGSSILTDGSRMDGCAGGVFGEIRYPLIQRVACGARVSGARYAGGLVGKLDWTAAQNAEISKSYYVGTVTATADFAAGVIGYVDASGVALTASHVKGVLVAGTITTPGGNVSLLANQKAGLAASGKIGVWDNTVINGQTVKSITDTSGQTGISNPPLPDGGTLYTAEQFKAWSTYTAMGFTDADVKFVQDDAYMPFVLGTDKTVLPNTAAYNGEAVGILKPFGGGNPDATAVYASGVNTVNIELSENAYPVTINGTEYEPDANGVITLIYDFKTTLTVDGVPYSSAELRRTVMTYGDYWYYIDDGLIYYGKGKQESSKPTVAGIHDAVHLWRGQVICSDGQSYTLNGGTAVNTGTNVAGISQLEDTRPFWSYTFSGMKVDVYHDFTLYAGERVNYRMFAINGVLYNVSPYQGMVYDGVMLSIYDDNVNAAKRYYALLGQDGSLVNYLTAWKAQSFMTDNIDHISNNLGYDGQIVLARYNDGSVAGYDYLKGELLFSTTSTATSFRLYAGHQLQSLFGSFFGGGIPVATDESYALSEVAINETAAEWLDGSTAPGSADADGTGQTGDFIGEVDGAVGEDDGAIGGGDGSIDSADTLDGVAHGADPYGGAEADGSNADGISGGDGTSNADGESTGDGNAEANGTGESGTADGAGDALGKEDGESEGSESAGSGDSGEQDEGEDADMDEGNGEAEAASSTYYVPGTGVVENNVVILPESAVSYVSGRGVYVGDELVYVESPVPTADMPAEQQNVKLVTPEERRSQALAAMPEHAVVYDPVTGGYTAVTGAQLLGEARETQADTEIYYAEDLVEDAERGDNTLEIGLRISRTLTEGEQNGFMLFAVVIAAAGVILVLVYIRAVRKRR